MIKKTDSTLKSVLFVLNTSTLVYQDATKVLSNCLRLVEETIWLATCRALDCSLSPIFPWDRRDIACLTIIVAILIFKCTKGVGVGDYTSSSSGRGAKTAPPPPN